MAPDNHNQNDPDRHLPSTARKVLKCSSCKKYLSYFPVYSYEDKNICGRCEKPTVACLQNTAYEKLASEIKFPCVFDTEGCLHFNFPADVPEHEKFCKFRILFCPCRVDGTDCGWNGRLTQLYEHFEDKHLALILKNARFEVSFVTNSTNYYLYPYFEEFFLINFNTDVSKNLCECKLIYLGTNKLYDQYQFKVIFQNVNKSDSREYVSNINETQIYEIEDIMSSLKDPVAIIVLLEVFKQVEDHPIVIKEVEVYDDILQDLECPVCFLYMVPPILQCETGHSYCKSCTDQMRECPTCKKSFNQTQNFSLERISKYVMYPCKNSECSFRGKSKVIKQHEANCRHSDFTCPLREYSECNFKSPLHKLPIHLRDKHFENIIEVEEIVMPFDEEDFDDAFILDYNFQLFLLHLKFEGDTFFWSVQTVGSTEDVNYNYHIDILDRCNNNHRYYFSGKCSKLTTKEEAFAPSNEFSEINYHQIAHMFDNDFGFRISIYTN